MITTDQINNTFLALLQLYFEAHQTKAPTVKIALVWAFNNDLVTHEEYYQLIQLFSSWNVRILTRQLCKY